MSLNVSFKGTVYDENDNVIDCKFQVHYVTQDVWNDVRDTSSQYYSCNAGDADSLTQDGALHSGDKILLCFWQGDGSGGATPDNRDDIFDRFGTYEIIYDGSTSDYVYDVKLYPKEAPNTSWSLPTTARLNRTVTANNYSNDNSSWVYGDITMRHIHTFEGVTVFPKVGVMTTTYDWGDDNDDVEGYESTHTHSFTVVDDYTVHIKVVNQWSLESIDSKDIRIKYNVPIGYVSFSPDGVTTKIHTTEDDTVTADITDEDSRITKITHKWIVINRDNGDNITTVDVDENTTLDYEYTQTINLLQRHFAKQVIEWNDGWEDLVVNYSRELIITNWLPLVNFDYTFLNDKKLRFTPSCSDIDGTVDIYTWKLYSLVPFTNGDYTLAKTDILTTDDDLDIEFESVGHYKMVLTATDDYGGSASYSKEFDITGASDCVGTNMIDEVFFIIPDEIDY